MIIDLDELERQLLGLGNEERHLEDLIQQLRAQARECGLAGRLDESDRAWEVSQKLREKLALLQVDIRRVECLLYGERNRRNR